ncbi:MAG: hypothetical protein KatS3mg105_0158 [Gemmatales bacterium]|nr:MAG: hypothetical protein KatS3mg105_0158 [Gemmatales bacterium]
MQDEAADRLETSQGEKSRTKKPGDDSEDAKASWFSALQIDRVCDPPPFYERFMLIKNSVLFLVLLIRLVSNSIASTGFISLSTLRRI